MKTSLFIKRLPHDGFAGDKAFQVVPYPLKSRTHAMRTLNWLRGNVLKDVPHDYRVRVYCSAAESEAEAENMDVFDVQ